MGIIKSTGKVIRDIALDSSAPLINEVRETYSLFKSFKKKFHTIIILFIIMLSLQAIELLAILYILAKLS